MEESNKIKRNNAVSPVHALVRENQNPKLVYTYWFELEPLLKRSALIIALLYYNKHQSKLFYFNGNEHIFSLCI